MRPWVSRDAASSGISVGGMVGLHLQVQEIAEEDGLLAVSAGAAEAKATAEDLAVRAALLAEEPGLAGWTLVNGVLGQGRALA